MMAADQYTKTVRIVLASSKYLKVKFNYDTGGFMALSRHHRYPRHFIRNIVILTVCSWALSIVFSLAAAPLTSESYHYREVTGEATKDVSWRLVKDEHYVLTYTSATSCHVTTTTLDYDTIRWKLVNGEEGADLSAERKGNHITVRGRLKGRPIDKTFEIDASPWYQATSLSLRDLVASDETERLFWTLRLDSLGAHKIRAIKQGMQTVETTGQSKTVLRIRLMLPGLLAPFWKSDCWFSMPEGIFFRFEGPSGPPGSPKTTVTRLEG
jgi:hypothetical protein